MKRRILFSIFIILTVSSLFAEPEIRFLGIEWGSSETAVNQIFEQNGFYFVQKSDDYDSHWVSSIPAEDTKIFTTYFSDQLYKINLHTDKNGNIDEVIWYLTDKYGYPSESQAAEDVYKYAWGLGGDTSLVLYLITIVSGRSWYSMEYQYHPINEHRIREIYKGL